MVSQDPETVAAIGPYEQVPPIPYEKGRGRFLLGSEGVWPPEETEAVRWRDVKALRVTAIEDGGDILYSLEAEMGGPTVSGPVRKAGLVFGPADPEFEARAKMIGDSLLQYFLDHGVAKDQWPIVDLAPRPEFTTAERLDRAGAHLAEFENSCVHGIDPDLGRYVELRPNQGILLGGSIFGLAFAGIGALVVPLSLNIGDLYRGAVLAIGGVVLVAVGVRIVFRAAWLWGRAGRRRLLVGVEGFRVFPDSESILWRQVSKIEVSAAGQGLTLKVGMRLGGKRIVRLAPLKVRGEPRFRYVTVQFLLESMLSASRSRV